MGASHERKDFLPAFFDKFLKHDLLTPEEEQALARFVHPGRSGTSGYVIVKNRRGRPRHCSSEKRSNRGRPSGAALRIMRPASRQNVFGIVHMTVAVAPVPRISLRNGDIELRLFRSRGREPVAILPVKYDPRWGWYVRWNSKTVDNGAYRLEAHITDELARRATHAFMAHNYRFVLGMARKYLWSGHALEDLFDAGVFGLQTAVDKFDPGRGFRFNTYATWWVRQTINQFVRTTSRAIRIPNQQWDRHHHIRTVLNKLGPDAPLEKVAEYVSMKIKKTVTPEMIEDTKAHFALQVQPFDIPSESDAGFSALDVVPDAGPDQLDSLMASETARSVTVSLGILTPREREIISLRYGLEDNETHTLQEIGEQFGVSRERVRQIETSILKKLAKRIGLRED